MKKLVKILIVFAVVAIAYLSLPYHVQMGLKHNFADVDDYKLFKSNVIHKSTHPEEWKISETYNKNKPSNELLNFFDERKTCAFLVIKNNKIVYERYAEDYNKETISGSFSMAKTVNALLIGKMIELGKIHSLEDEVKKYVPELTQIPSGKLTIKDVITMSADIDWDESYWNIYQS